MKRTRFSAEQIIGVLKETEAGVKTGELARRHRMSEAAIYNSKAKHGGLEVSDAKRRPTLFAATRFPELEDKKRRFGFAERTGRVEWQRRGG